MAKHGGARTPAKPAAVSGPGAHSQRTDGGTADLAAAGGPYGSRKAIEDQAASAPVETGGGGGGAGPVAGAPQPPQGAFGPTQRPNEPITEGLIGGQEQGGEPDTENILRALYEQYPSSYIARLLHD